MGKRSDFQRIAKDAYQTIDPRAVAALVPHLNGVRTFAEPCAGYGHLICQLEDAGFDCEWSSDIDHLPDPIDAREITAADLNCVDAIITNPPWSRPLLHELIAHFQSLAPTWLLFDSDWAFTKQAAPFLPQCSHIVAVGRLIWIPGTKMTGKENCSWYRFDKNHSTGPRFIGQAIREAA